MAFLFEPTPPAIQIANNGYLDRVCSYVSHNDLRQLRQVCRSWNICVGRQEKFRKSVCRVGPCWEKQETSCDPYLCHRWHGAHFTNLFVLNKRLFKMYWALQKDSLCVLKLSGIRIPCDQVFNFINEHPRLEELCFNRNEFVEYRYTVEPPAGMPRWQINIFNRNRRTCCIHQNGMANVVGENPNLPAPSLRTIRIKQQPTFPLCLLDLMVNRCRGTLQHLSYKDSPMNPYHRRRTFPSEAAVRGRLMQMVTQNFGTLQSLELSNINRLGQYIINIHETMGQDQVNRPMQLRALTLEECVYIDRDLDNNQIDWWGAINFPNANLQANFLTVLNALPHNIETIDFRFLHHWVNTPQLMNALTRMHFLKYLRIEIPGRRFTQAQVDDLLQANPRLETFKLIGHRDCTGILNSAISVRTHAPDLKSLLYFYVPDVPRPLEGLRNLTSLAIHGNAQAFETAEFQSLIRSLPQLENLELNGMHRLTDSDFCGLRQELIEQIQNSDPAFRAELGNRLMGDAERQQLLRLASWTKLKSLKLRSGNFTDVTVAFAIRGDYLKELDLTRSVNVTDDALFHLGSNNVALERVILLQNRMVTRDGINELIRARPTICKIRTQKLTISKRSDANGGKNRETLALEDQPGFKRIVSIAQKNEVHAPPPNET